MAEHIDIRVARAIGFRNRIEAEVRNDIARSSARERTGMGPTIDLRVNQVIALLQVEAMSELADSSIRKEPS